MTPDREQLREKAARIMCDQAWSRGDRLHGWDDSAEETREMFRASADAVLAVLPQYEQCGWAERNESGYGSNAWILYPSGGPPLNPVYIVREAEE